jgi:hypothetical protein
MWPYNRFISLFEKQPLQSKQWIDGVEFQDIPGQNEISDF